MKLRQLLTGDLPEEAVFRNRVFTRLITLGLICEVPAFTVVLLKVASRHVDAGAGIAAPLTFAVGLAVQWVLAITSAVRVRPDCLIIDNALLRYTVPWERFAQVSIEPVRGMVFTAYRFGAIRSITYGRSLAGSMNGYKLMGARRDEIAASCEKAVSAHEATVPVRECSKRINLPLAPLGMLLLWAELTYWVGVTIFHA